MPMYRYPPNNIGGVRLVNKNEQIVEPCLIYSYHANQQALSMNGSSRGKALPKLPFHARAQVIRGVGGTVMCMCKYVCICVCARAYVYAYVCARRCIVV